MQILSSYIEGFVMGAGLIIAIGAQNAFVLKQGIRREHRSVIAWICSISDALLITLGIAGMGFLFNSNPLLTKIISFAGSAYLAWLGFKCFLSAARGESLEVESSGNNGLSLKKAVITALALTYLNPHVYLDTVVMLGGFGASRPAGLRPFFGLGAASASFIWFFSLAYSGSILAPFFKDKSAWRILDTGIGFVMFYIAVKLALFGMSA